MSHVDVSILEKCLWKYKSSSLCESACFYINVAPNLIFICTLLTETCVYIYVLIFYWIIAMEN